MSPIFFDHPDKFREWLKENHEKETELWVGFYKKATGLPSLTWSESVDQALCYGWIDGIRKSIDDKSYKIRFTPRKPTSIWSKVNIEKIEELTKNGLMKPAGLAAWGRRDLEKQKIYAYEQKNAKLPEKYADKIKNTPEAWAFFESLAPSYKKATIWWIVSAKREETRLRRLDILIQSSKEGLKIPQLRQGKK